mmetsp:Transcript_24971/g.49987  ORF Transcript_24971/g.49987 Transcript_24971/m.49987 type:complete len:119 (-) Transcript_24971:977-1333(-)
MLSRFQKLKTNAKISFVLQSHCPQNFNNHRIPTWCKSSKHLRHNLTASSYKFGTSQSPPSFFPEPFPFATLPENNLHDGGQPPFTTLILKCLPPLARNSCRSASDANVQHLSQAPLWE